MRKLPVGGCGDSVCGSVRAGARIPIGAAAVPQVEARAVFMPGAAARCPVSNRNGRTATRDRAGASTARSPSSARRTAATVMATASTPISLRNDSSDQGTDAAGVHSNLGRMGDSVNQHRRPQLSSEQGIQTSRRFNGGGVGGGSGVHSPSLWRQLPDLSGTGSAGRGIFSPTLDRRRGLVQWFEVLADRLRRTRVCCGDWARVVTPSITSYIGTTGIVLDPPYQQDLREICYSEDHDVSADVRAWALEHGDNPKLRIALCGYQGGHEMPASWECVSWKAGGGYGRTARGKANRKRERIWFSPHCLRETDKLQFDLVEASA